MNNSFELKRKEFYLFEGIYTRLVVKALPLIGTTAITPNQVTIINLINSALVCVLLLSGDYFLSAVLIQLYLILDILDGNLARYKEMSSKMGQILDQIADRFFYNLAFLILGYCVGNTIWTLLAYAIVTNSYGLVTTFYIVPGIRKVKPFVRWGIKKRLMSRGIIFGMDLSAQDVIATVLLCSPWAFLIVPIITALYAADLLFRLHELRKNQQLVV